MQYFQTKAGQVFAFDPDVAVTEATGVYSFSDARGVKLDVPADLAPCPNNAPPGPTLAQAQTAQSAVVKAACAAAIVSGFSSTALGTTHTYGSQQTDQQNVDRATVAGGSLWCINGGGWSLADHTAAQAQQVRADMWAHIQAQQAKYASLLSQIAAATTAAGAQAVVWS